MTAGADTVLRYIQRLESMQIGGAAKGVAGSGLMAFGSSADCPQTPPDALVFHG
jgi:hypothetical protein